jgi:hypothetical protein
MKILARIWQWRFVRILVWLTGSLISLYFLLCGWVNYEGARRWTAAQAMLQGEGETVDFRKITPELIEEEKNFCAIPALKDIALSVDGDTGKGEPGAKRKRLDEATLPSGKGEMTAQRPRQNNGASFGKATDLTAWDEWLRKEGSLPLPPDSGNASQDILNALAKHEALITELTAGLKRTEAQWTPEWKTRELPRMLFEIQLPHYQTSQHLVPMLTLRAAAAARAGDAAKAHESLLITLRLARASLKDPFLIGSLVACAQITQASGAAWELCDAHSGSADDFRRLEEEFTKLDFRTGILHAFRGEMAGAADAVIWLGKSRDPRMFSMMTESGTSESSSLGALAIVRVIPNGLFAMNAATIADLEFRYLIKPLRDEGLPARSDKSAELEAILKQRKARVQPDSILACLVMPAVLKVQERVAYSQCITDQTVIACALERFRIEKGNYPESLEAVKLADGKPLPLDIMSGKPMGYRKTTNGKYTLWSIGFDGKDDDGQRKLDPKKPENTRFSDGKYVGDWVWDFPSQ